MIYTSKVGPKRCMSKHCSCTMHLQQYVERYFCPSSLQTSRPPREEPLRTYQYKNVSKCCHYSIDEQFLESLDVVCGDDMVLEFDRSI